MMSIYSARGNRISQSQLFTMSQCKTLAEFSYRKQVLLEKKRKCFLSYSYRVVISYLPFSSQTLNLSYWENVNRSYVYFTSYVVCVKLVKIQTQGF